VTTLVYNAPPSVQGFLQDTSFVDLIMGPVGSTKTTAGIMRIAYMAKRMAPCTDGIRRSRAVWIRNTREQLDDTSIPDFLKWYPDGPAGSFQKTGRRFILRFDDVECEVLFRGLDDQNDVRRLLSLQISFAIMDEFREIHKDIFEAVQGRLGRYPDGMLVPHRPEWGVDEKGNPIQGCVTDEGKPNKHIWGMSNPPELGSFWEEYISNPPKNAKIYIQPGGLSVEADWIKYLPANYYEDLAEGKSEEWVDVYIHAKFGASLQGKPVFKAFNNDTHIAKGALRVLPNTPVIIGVDAGLSPAAVIAQVDYQGRVVVHDSLISESMGALRFIREKLQPLIANKYAGYQLAVVIDPAAFQRAQTDERTVADIFRANGFVVKAARTNNIATRISSVDAYLTRTVNGSPGFLINPVGCAPLIAAMRGKYRYKINTKGDVDYDKPEKLHPWSDVADALQYVCLWADGGQVFGQLQSRGARPVSKAKYVYT
jgi:hypothetical protein